ncbi:ftsH, partial [Symbiodinium sp. CCMP2456]
LLFLRSRAPGGGGIPGFGNQGQAKIMITPETGVKFEDVAGIDEAKEELMEIVDFLKAPERFVKVGAKIPRGVLLTGPPGTGKTLMAKALAGESGVPFIQSSASEFIELFVGVGASRVRDIFKQAKEKAPCIVFIDEIDAIGRQRGAGMGGGNDEREQTLNQILTEMDGFEGNQGNGSKEDWTELCRRATGVKFEDVAGIDEAKEELMEIVDFLKAPERFVKVGAKIPRGVLLTGPPGTGKTLMAKALAGESGVPFIQSSASEFIELFVGVGASRVRDIFKQAKEKAPCIVFIDEIDAIGRQRGAGMGGGNDEREQTLNQILTEMDGFEGNSGNLMNESAILAARRNKKAISMDEINDATDRVIAGLEGRALQDNAAKKLIAYHEAGHAIVGTLLPYHDPVNKVTLIPRGQAKGLTWFTPGEDQSLISAAMLKARIAGALGGRAAEQLVFGTSQVTTGAGGDLQQVERMARAMVTQFGMSEVGSLAIDDGGFMGPDYSEELSSKIDNAIKEISDDCYLNALNILMTNRACLDR